VTAKEYLRQAPRIIGRLRVMSEQLDYLKAAAEYISPQFSDMPRPATRNLHKNEDAIIKRITFEEKMQAEYEKLEEINLIISSVGDPDEQLLLVKRYLEDLNWYEVAKALAVCLRRVHQIHGSALASVDALLKKSTPTTQ